MSLINDMLKDLEKRRSDEIVAKDDSLQELSSVRHNRHKGGAKRLFILIVLLVLLVLGWGWFKYKPSKTHAVAPVKVKKTVAKKQTVSVKPEVATETKKAEQVDPLHNEAELKSVTVTQDEEKISLQLNLTHPIHYQLHTSLDHQLLTLTLSNTELAQSLPSIENAMIDSVLLSHVNGDLLFMLKVVPNTEVKSLVMSETEPFTLDLVLINKEIGAMPLITDVESVDKTKATSTLQLAEGYYSDALKLINQGEVEKAKIKLEKCLEKLPKFVPARKLWATLLVKQKKYNQAGVLLRKGLEDSPDSGELIKLYAQVLVEQKHLRSALMVLKRISPDLMEDPEYYAFVATLQQRLGQPLIAAQLYKQLLEQDANNGTWWMGLGIALESAERPNAALNAYEHAVDSGDLSPNVQAYIETKISQLGS